MQNGQRLKKKVLPCLEWEYQSPRQETRGCFREFVTLSLREQPEAGVINIQAKSVL